MTQGNIYFDYNATTPVDPMVQEKLLEWVSLWGNPSSIHKTGRGPKKLLRDSRRSLANRLSCHPLELIFTSGGSEANNLAIKGLLKSLKIQGSKRNKVIIGSIEHPSVLKQIPAIEEMGFEVHLLPVDPSGYYDMQIYEDLLDESVALVSVMLANNEIGVIAPIKSMVEKAHSQGAYFHSDMVQALGKYPFDLAELGVDLATFSSHKVYALRGTGMLYLKKGTPLQAMIDGGAQERGRRAGTENLMAIASFALMTEKIKVDEFVETLTPLRNLFEEKLCQSVEGVHILGAKVERLANTSCFTIEGVSGESLLMNLDIRGFSVGTGAACSSGNPEPSPVLLALGLKREEAQSSLRISMGRMTTLDQVLSLVDNLQEVVDHLRKLEQSGEKHVASL